MNSVKKNPIDNFNPLKGGKPVNKDILKAISNASEQTGRDPLFIKALIAAESSFNKKATNPKGTAAGLMQLTKPTREEMGLSESDKFDIEKNVLRGSEHLNLIKDIAEENGVKGEENLQLMMAIGHRVGQTDFRNAVRKAKKKNLEMNVVNILDQMSAEDKKNATETMNKVTSLMQRMKER